MIRESHHPSSSSIILCGLIALITGCASAPRLSTNPIPSDTYPPAEVLRDTERAYVARQWNPDEWQDVQSLMLLPSQTPTHINGLTSTQIDLVANRAIREICLDLAPYYALTDSQPDAIVQVTLEHIELTSKGAAGVSEILGLFVPGPFRLPTGLGGLAMTGQAFTPQGGTYVLTWREGAGAFTESAKLSPIGDAYQLAHEFSKDFVHPLTILNDHAQTPSSKKERLRLDSSAITANLNWCRVQFGEVSAAARTSSFVLPLSPESIDSGRPASN